MDMHTHTSHARHISQSSLQDSKSRERPANPTQTSSKRVIARGRWSRGLLLLLRLLLLWCCLPRWRLRMPPLLNFATPAAFVPGVWRAACLRAPGPGPWLWLDRRLLCADVNYDDLLHPCLIVSGRGGGGQRSHLTKTNIESYCRYLFTFTFVKPWLVG